MRNRGKPVAVFSLVLALGLSPFGGSAPAHAATKADIGIDIQYPEAGQVIGSRGLTASGSVSGIANAVTRVVYAADLSGSTGSPDEMDCNGDGKVTAQRDDYNQDDSIGDTLDCEISGIVSLNAALRAVPGSNPRISVGLAGFGDTAAMADLDPGSAETFFTSPGTTGGDRDVVPRINAVAASLTRGQIGRETWRYVGTGTDFQSPLEVAAEALNAAGNGDKWIFLLSDGQASLPDTTKLVASGIRVRTFAIGDSATCATGSPLREVAAATGEICVSVTDPTALRTDIVSTTPAEIKSVTAQLDTQEPVSAGVDALGNWQADLGRPSVGGHTLTVRLERADGRASAPVVRQFSVKAGTRYVALGDSFSSGEGNAPYVDQREFFSIPLPNGGRVVQYQNTPGFLCHRSAKSWPSQVVAPGSGTPIADRGSFTFQACSGARLVNFDTQKFAKTYAGVTTQIPLQQEALSTDADLVTFSFGGNDVGFAPIIAHCASQLNCWKDEFIKVSEDTWFEQSVSLDDWAKIRIALIQNELGGLYQQIRSKVRPDTAIVAATYPRLLRVPSRPCTIGGVIAKQERRWLADRVDEFSDIVAEQARRSNILVADVRDEFDGHAVCDGDDWIYSREASRETDLDQNFAGASSFHPNEKGVKAYARVVSAALKDGGFQAKSRGTRASGTRPADPAAIQAAARAEDRAVAGPIVKTVSPAMKAETDDKPGDDVLAQYPKALVEAVRETTFTTVVVGDGAAMRRLPSCPRRVVRGERVPISAQGFRAGTKATAYLAWEGSGDPEAITIRADDRGRVKFWVPIPQNVPLNHPVSLQLRGITPNQAGTVVGVANLTATDDQDCIHKVEEAGLLASPETGQNPPDANDPGGLADTGVGPWFADLVLAGVVLMFGGMLLGRRRRGTIAQ